MTSCMINSIRNTLILGIISLVLIACGNSSDDPPISPPSPPPQILKGVFTDALVSGIAYSTETRSGFTDVNGEYDYIAGETVTFSIGDIVLGSVIAGPVVTPLTLIGTTDVTDQAVINIVRLLLTLDSDGNPDNGIEITANTRIAATGVTINFDVPVAIFGADTTVADLVVAAETTSVALVDDAVAQLHLTTTLASTWGTMDWGTGNWSAN